MRDFARDVREGVAWIGALPAAEPSWSLARHRLFQFCRRAYFINHHLAQGGWDEHSHPLVRQAYVEKHISTGESWIAGSLNAALRAASLRTAEAQASRRDFEFRSAFKRELSRGVSRGAVQLRNREWRVDPKVSLNLFEIYYGADGASAFRPFEDAVEELGRLAKAFLLSDAVLGLIAAEPLSWRFLRPFESFRLARMELWAAPPLTRVSDGRAFFFEIRYAQPDPEDASLDAGMLDLLAADLFKTPCGTSAVTFCQPDGAAWIVPASGHLALRALAPRSAAEMASSTRPDGTVSLEDFPKRGEADVCAKCRFKGVCGKLG
jgi:hypothetical protein